MNKPNPHAAALSSGQRVKRTQRIIYITMFVFIVTPFIVAWFTGALRF
jgi:hypothetical protein